MISKSIFQQITTISFNGDSIIAIFPEQHKLEDYFPLQDSWQPKRETLEQQVAQKCCHDANSVRSSSVASTVKSKVANSCMD